MVDFTTERMVLYALLTPGVSVRSDANIAQLVEQRFRKPQVKGSSPFIGSSRGVAQLGSASGSGPEGHRFKSCHLDF